MVNYFILEKFTSFLNYKRDKQYNHINFHLFRIHINQTSIYSKIKKIIVENNSFDVSFGVKVQKKSVRLKKNLAIYKNVIVYVTKL